MSPLKLEKGNRQTKQRHPLTFRPSGVPSRQTRQMRTEHLGRMVRLVEAQQVDPCQLQHKMQNGVELIAPLLSVLDELIAPLFMFDKLPYQEHAQH